MSAATAARVSAASTASTTACVSATSTSGPQKRHECEDPIEQLSLDTHALSLEPRRLSLETGLFGCFSGLHRFPPSPVRNRRRRLGEAEFDCSVKPTLADGAAPPCPSLPPACVYDVVGDGSGGHALLPISGEGPTIALSTVPEDASVTIRVFRFFEDWEDEAKIWEQELRNVNSGSLLWVLVHMVPRMHSVRGCKYGTCFVEHHIRVLAKNFKTGYHMSEAGSSLANTFGATGAVTSLVSGEKLQNPYFWFVTPDRSISGVCHSKVTDDEMLQKHGWQHVHRAGPFDGDDFVSEWRKQSSPMDELSIQRILRSVQ